MKILEWRVEELLYNMYVYFLHMNHRRQQPVMLLRINYASSLWSMSQNLPKLVRSSSSPKSLPWQSIYFQTAVNLRRIYAELLRNKKVIKKTSFINHQQKKKKCVLKYFNENKQRSEPRSNVRKESCVVSKPSDITFVTSVDKYRSRVMRAFVPELGVQEVLLVEEHVRFWPIVEMV